MCFGAISSSNQSRPVSGTGLASRCMQLASLLAKESLLEAWQGKPGWFCWEGKRCCWSGVWSRGHDAFSLVMLVGPELCRPCLQLESATALDVRAQRKKDSWVSLEDALGALCSGSDGSRTEVVWKKPFKAQDTTQCRKLCSALLAQ